MTGTKLDWRFSGHPQVDKDGESDIVIVKTTVGDVALCQYLDPPFEGTSHWYDVNTHEYFDAGIVCWAYLGKIPETTQPMGK